NLMRAIIPASVLFAGLASADEVADRAAITKTIDGLSVWPPQRALFTADFDFNDQRELSRLVAGLTVVCPTVWWETCAPAVIGEDVGTLVISKEPWGEATWTPA